MRLGGLVSGLRQEDSPSADGMFWAILTAPPLWETGTLT